MKSILSTIPDLLKAYSRPLISVGLTLLLPFFYSKYKKYLPLSVTNLLALATAKTNQQPEKAKIKDEQLPKPVITPVESTFNYLETEEFPYRPFKPMKPGEYKPTLAIKKADPLNYINVEKSYLKRTNLRVAIMEKYPDTVMHCHESAVPVLKEFYDIVVDFLTKRYPMHFTKETDLETGEVLFFNKIRDEKFPFSSENVESTQIMLNILGRTLEEDFILLVKNPKADDLESEYNDEYLWRGSVSCFPAGFDPKDKFDKPMTAIHGPVPDYLKRLKLSMNRFFSRLRVHEHIVRNNWGVQTHTKLFAPYGSHATPDEEENLDAIDPATLDFNKVFLRVEKQTFTRIPETKADVMLSRTYITPIIKVRQEGNVEDFCSAIDSLNRQMGVYKRRICWGEAVKSYLRGESNGTTDVVCDHEFVLEEV